MQGRANRYQLTIPSFLSRLPTQWAIENNWHCSQRKPNTDKPYHPHTSFVHACLVAKVAAMSRDERQAFLLGGARLVFAQEQANKVPGRERVRLYQSDKVRPAGIASRAAQISPSRAVASQPRYGCDRPRPPSRAVPRRASVPSLSASSL